jgi:hypothetical protein
MDFIFMLTRDDQTVKDCLELFEGILPVGLTHVGFKDVGVDKTTLKSLTDAINDAGAVSYMEVVSTSNEAAIESARNAVELGVQRLLGGTQVREIAEIVKGTSTSYYPFPGSPQGHPTRLGGNEADVEAHCRGFMQKGCAGCDILAYRATEAEPVALVRAARRGLGDGYLIVAGSVNTVDRINEIAAAGADAFTIGTAIFDGSYAPRMGTIQSQLKAVLEDCEGVSGQINAA